MFNLINLIFGLNNPINIEYRGDLYVYLNVNTIPLIYFLLTASAIFVIGFIGIGFVEKNIIIIFLCLELMTLAVSLNFIAFSTFSFDPKGQIYALLLIVVAAAESATGLSILVAMRRSSGSMPLSRTYSSKYF